MKTSRKRRLVALGIATAALLFSGAVTVMGTLSFFTDEETVNNHVTAGTLKFDYQLISLTGQMPDENGILQSYTKSDVPVDLRTSTDEVFSIDNAVPGLNLTAKFKVTNTGSVAFNSVTKLINLTLDDTKQTESEALAGALQIALYKNPTETKAYWALSDYENHSLSFDQLNNSGFVEYYVDVKLPTTVGNNVQGGSVHFDINLTATQVHS